MKMNHVKLLVACLIGCIGMNGVYCQTNAGAGLKFNPDKFELQTLSVDGKAFMVRAYENIVYVAKPVDTMYQKLNIYIPEAYFEGKSINGFTSETAPVFFPNKIGGYMPAIAATALPSKNTGFPGGSQQSALLVALSKGYVVASAGARGRTTKDKDGVFTGKAPAVIIDLKAAVRYLKFNDKVMPGDAGKIISNGTSAGGALSVLLGSNGNNPDYAAYLKSLGAADATDDIFAVSAYCPITNLEHADIAYEWQFNGVKSYTKRGFPQAGNSGTNGETVSLTKEQIDISNQLKDLFPAYVNNLQLKDKNGNLVTLDPNGNGNFRELVKSYVMASAQKVLGSGADLSNISWLKIENNKVVDLDFEMYVNYIGRMKTPPAFDALDLSTPENQLFGTEKIDKQHFTDFAAKNSTVNATTVDNLAVVMMNPLYYIGQPQTNTAKHWRIRHGSKDKDTGLAISVILTTLLQNKGFDVSLEFPWDRPHSGDYDLEELFQWTDEISR
jgi:hypothetical protein